MSDLAFCVLGSHALSDAATPTLALRLQITESTGLRVHMIALRTQIRILPQLRRYAADERFRLTDLFGTPERYGDTLKPLLWTHVSTTVLGFRDETEIELDIPCSYDFDVAAHKYLAALADGVIPLALYFSGAVFVQGERDVHAEFVSWGAETAYPLPIAVWRETMDAHFPNAAWVRVSREVFDELDRYRITHGLRSWDAALGALYAAERAR